MKEEEFMDFFSRNVMMTGAPTAYMAFATEMRAYVSDKLLDRRSLSGRSDRRPALGVLCTARVDGLAGVHAMN